MPHAGRRSRASRLGSGEHVETAAHIYNAIIRGALRAMATFPLYSKRQKQLRGEVPDVYVYDTFPNPFRVQVVHIWQDTLGNLDQYHDLYCQVSSTYEFIVQTLC